DDLEVQVRRPAARVAAVADGADDLAETDATVAPHERGEVGAVVRETVVAVQVERVTAARLVVALEHAAHRGDDGRPARRPLGDGAERVAAAHGVPRRRRARLRTGDDELLPGVDAVRVLDAVRTRECGDRDAVSLRYDTERLARLDRVRGGCSEECEDHERQKHAHERSSGRPPNRYGSPSPSTEQQSSDPAAAPG